MTASSELFTLPLISPSSRLRHEGELIERLYQFNFQFHEKSGALLLLPESDLGFIDEVRGSPHREPEGHIDMVATKILDSLSSLGTNFKELKIVGMSDKDFTILNLIGERTGSTPEIIYPGLHCLEIEMGLLEYPANQRLALADLVVARHILEHARDVDRFLAGIRGSLKPASLCLIEVPNSNRIFSHGEVSQFWEEHSAYMTPETLKTLLTISGFRVHWLESLVSEGEEICVALIQTSIESGAIQIASNNESSPGKDFIQKLPNFVQALSTQLQDEASQIDLWIYGANHAAGFFLDAFVNNGVEVRGVLDDNAEKEGLYLSRMRVPISTYESLPKASPLWILISIPEARAPGLYLKLRADTTLPKGSRVQSLASFCNDVWKEME